MKRAGIAQHASERRPIPREPRPEVEGCNPSPRSTDPIRRAWCYATGLIDFGASVPRGAIIIARGPDTALRAFIAGVARHGYETEYVDGRVIKKPGTDCLLVPGAPEVPDQASAFAAVERWLDTIKDHAPRGVVVI